MSARILLPVLPHIKKYLQIQYGKEMAVSDRGVVSFLLLNMLEKHHKKDPSKVKPSQRLIDNKKYFPYPIFIGDSYERTRGLYLTKENMIRFNESVDDMLREEMFRFCKNPGYNIFEVDKNIVCFRDFYGITEDELPFENLKRWYYRERQRLEDRVKVEIRYEPQLILSF
jgi:hypothetical protein